MTAFLSSSLCAQPIWNVTPGTLLATIAAAASGDTLVLSPSASPYPAFQLTKGLTIVGNDQRVGSSGASVIVDVPQGEVANLASLRFAPLLTPVEVMGPGITRLESCSFRGPEGSVALTASSTNIVMQSCSLSQAAAHTWPTDNTAMRATASHVAMRNCALVGDQGAMWWTGTTPNVRPSCRALTMTSGTLHAEDTSFTGGDASGSPTYLAAAEPAISNTGGSLVFFGCTVTAGGGPNFPESIVHNGPEIQASGSVFTPPPSGPLQTAAPLVALRVAPSWQLGMTSLLITRGQPGAIYGIWLASSTPSALPQVVERIWIDLSAPVAVVLGVLDPLGTALVGVAVPNTPSLQYATVMCQALSGTNLPLHASVVAGGLVR